MFGKRDPKKDPKEDPKGSDSQYDGTGTYTNGETTVWYDTDGNQHVEVNQK